ncbi:motility associated factor glycosyltransferase family protein [Tepidibacter sp. Z1-5]|uniref:motility associated factor glycosyltransferase family protein n=1 Tax=Tepidibacter sp. Z1-5 TaxID=3134138 RepID=UPI0030BCCC76
MKNNIIIHETKDNYKTFEIKKDDKEHYLGNIESYQSDIDKLIENFSDLRFDSLIFIFGLDTGTYLEELQKSICDLNKVFIFEPNLEICEKYKENFKFKNIELLPFEEEIVKEILSQSITTRNYVNIYMSSFGNYEHVYKDEYDKFIEILDYNYNKSATFRNTSYCFKEIHLKNILSNLEHINKSSPFDYYINSNENIPAIVVSAGPSLDKNIKDLLRFKDKLDKFFIIAGNRTLGPLIKNNIKPDLVMSIDPQEVTYKMLSDYLEEDIPLVFHEKSNERLVREYKGHKIYTSQGLFSTIEPLRNMTICYSGGSVAHCSVDIAVLLGCNPIILVGQDLAYTYEKDHAQIARLPIDDISGKNEDIVLTDVYGKDIKSNSILKIYKKNLEYYIKAYTEYEDKSFINVSYGAHIENTVHKELKDVLKDSKYKQKKNSLDKKMLVEIDYIAIKKSLLDYMDEYITRCEKNVYVCNDLIQNPVSDEEARVKFKEVLDTIDEFIKDKRSLYINGYVDMFLFEIKEKYFRTSAKDYGVISSNLVYQCSVFSIYFKELKKMLEEIKNKMIER